MPLLHPSARRLQRFADGECAEPERTRVAGHLVSCARCRTTVGAARTIAAAARAAAVPPLPDGLLERVLAARAAGARVVLPTVEPLADLAPATAAPRRRRMRVAAAAAVVLAAALVPYLARRDRAPAVRDVADAVAAPDAMPNESTNVLPATVHATVLDADVFPTLANVVRGGLLPAPAAAQPSPTPVLPRLLVDGRRLRAMRLTYEMRVTERGRNVGQPERGWVDVADATVDGVRAWRVADAWTGHPHDMVETTYVDRRTLAPLRRVAHDVGPSRYVVVQRFANDSVTGTMRSARGVTNIARALPASRRPLLVGDGSIVTLLQAVVLGAAERGAGTLVGWGAMPADVVYPLSLAVDGAEQVRVPTGAWDCWRITLSVGGRRRRMWVRKADGVVVRTVDDTSTPGRIEDVSLVAERPA